MKLKMHIHKMKCVNDLEISLPVDKGLYAITGQNGAGKSTVVACASTAFYDMGMEDHFGKTDSDASIEFELDSAKQSWRISDGEWKKKRVGYMKLREFYEGSIIFGTRFKNTNMANLRRLDSINDSAMIQAPEFIRTHLGRILHNDESFYEKLFMADEATKVRVSFRGDVFYYQKGSKRVSQFHMSTGENLLISILNSINLRNSDRRNLSKPCVLFLDEIELALHPSSLKRLTDFLKIMSEQFNYAIYFSTHSIELISVIKPDNIFFLDRKADDSIDVINPCYPAYATRFLYDHSGYDRIILVEDDLARMIIKRLLREYRLLDSRLVHVMPCGGYSNVIELAREVVDSNLLGKTSSVVIILDGDVKDKVKGDKTNNIPIGFLPLESLEKYLRTNLYIAVNHGLFRRLNDYIFHNKSLVSILEDYKNTGAGERDNNGKKLYDLIDNELRNLNVQRETLVEMVVDFLMEDNNQSIESIVAFLKKQLES